MNSEEVPPVPKPSPSSRRLKVTGTGEGWPRVDVPYVRLRGRWFSGDRGGDQPRRMRVFANFCHDGYDFHMGTMNISLPDSLKDFVDERVDQGGYGTSSEYVRELIRKDQDRLRLRGLLLAGAKTSPAEAVDETYFDRLRSRAKAVKPGKRR
jgi:antitoxin ParD1/3/4